MKGYLGVEFFFILGGFLLFKHFENYTLTTSIENYNFNYLKQRMMRLFPQHAFSWICMCFISIGLYNNTWQNIITKGYGEFLLLQSFGFPSIVINGVVWFLSALLLATYCIGYLILKKRELFIYIIAPISVGVIYGYFAKNYNTFNTGNLFFLRGFAGMSLGCIGYCLYKKFVYSRFNNCIITSLYEVVALAILLIYCAFGVYINDFLFSFICVLFIVSTFGNSSIISRLLNNRYSAFLGKISFAFYLNQNITKHLTSYWLFPEYEMSPFFKASTLIFLNILLSLFSIFLIEWLQNKMSLVRSKHIKGSSV